MKFLKLRSLRFLNDKRALESSEFAVMLAAIVVVVYGAFQLLGGNISQVVTTVANAI
jgi:Flp pilus assembly pilin Flp